MDPLVPKRAAFGAPTWSPLDVRQGRQAGGAGGATGRETQHTQAGLSERLSAGLRRSQLKAPARILRGPILVSRPPRTVWPRKTSAIGQFGWELALGPSELQNGALGTSGRALGGRWEPSPKKNAKCWFVAARGPHFGTVFRPWARLRANF